jgi:quercetin dioxygenase-like cupin family protein
MKLLAVAVSAALVSACAAPSQAPKRNEGLVLSGVEGLLLKRDEITARPPASDLGPVRVWIAEKTPDVVCFLIEITGVLPLHSHPDGVHRLYVIEGRVRFTVGSQTKELGPGDYIMIPRDVPHRVEAVGGKAWYASVDTPPIDPKKIVWIEPKPGGR